MASPEPKRKNGAGSFHSQKPKATTTNIPPAYSLIFRRNILCSNFCILRRISSGEMLGGWVGWLCQRPRISGEEDSLVMIASCLKAPSENVFQAMDLRGDVAAGDARHLRDSGSVYAFEIE